LSSLITPSLWHNACLIYEKHLKTTGKPIGRRKLADVLGISESLARGLLFAIRNQHVFTLKSQIVSEQKDIELVLADLHIPYHDQLAVNTVFDYLDTEHITPTIITILGDLIDFYKISRFSKDPTRKSVRQEIDEARNFLNFLRNKYPDARIFYLYGNHEQRLTRYIADNAQEIYDLVQDLLEVRLNVKELNITVYTEPFRIGKLWHLHGHERVGSYQPEHITNVIWKYVHDHFIVGHFHRNQEKVFKRIDGELYWGGAVGHLATSFEYALLNNWTQGFAIIRYDDRGRFRATIKTVYKGEVF